MHSFKLAIWDNKPIKIFYERLFANGKLKKVALVASMIKLLIILKALSPLSMENIICLKYALLKTNMITRVAVFPTSSRTA